MGTELTQIPKQTFAGESITSGIVAAARIAAAMATDAEVAAAIAAHLIAAGHAPTDIFAPVNAGTEMLYITGTYCPIARMNAATEWGSAAFYVPVGFSTIVAAKIICVPTFTNVAANYDVYTNYGAVGQALATHSQNDTASTYNVTNGALFEIDIAALLTSLAAGDYVSVRLLQTGAGDNVDMIGVRFKWS